MTGRQLFLRVTNLNRQTFTDGFANTFWDFEPNKPVDIPEEAATHIFGVVLTEKGVANTEASFLHVARRWGLIHARDKADRELLTKARHTYNKLKFEVLRMQLQAVKLEPADYDEGDDQQAEALGGPGG